MPDSGPPSIATTVTRISEAIIAELGRLSSPEIRVTTFTIATTIRAPPAAASVARAAPHGISHDAADRRAAAEVSAEDAIGDTIGGSVSAPAGRMPASPPPTARAPR